MRQLQATDFETTATDAEVTVLFKPSESYFTFSRLANGGVSETANVRHAQTGDTGDYIEEDVGIMATRLAQQHAAGL